MNFLLLEYALNSLKRSFSKNLFIFFVLMLLTSLLASMFFITHSLRYELLLTLKSLPDIVLQKKKAAMLTSFDEREVENILEISGVKSLEGRVWGYYYFEKEKLYFSLFGVDAFEEQQRTLLVDLFLEREVDVDSIVVGKGVAEVLARSYYSEYFNFIQDDGKIKKLFIDGTFKASTALESNDMILINKTTLREIFGFKEHEVSDVAIYVTNKDELPTVALKITNNYPNYSLTTKEDVRVSYENIFNYKSGLFLALFIVAIFTFFIIIYDRLTGVTSAQKREIGILKAIGWRIEDLLRAKLYESLILSISAYLFGLFLAFVYVYILNAPLLKDVFIGYTALKPSFELIFVFDLQTLFLLFLLSVPLYVLATLIPAWRIATLDAQEVMQ
jgi:ABC-type lipoprotein release transport system permease subunit